MPAQNLHRVHSERTYCHVYNRGAAKALIFKDKYDYDAFLSFLSQYLSTPLQQGVNLKTFTVRGRSFQGAPHQTKNFFNQVELVAYSLNPDHLHLVLYQVEENTLQCFIKSLCTRYSIYFNKKYKCSGSLFDGPYKSTKIDDLEGLAHITRYIHLHTNPNSTHTDLAEYHSSYPEYLGTRTTLWIKPGVVLSLFDKSNNNFFKGLSDYRSFVESYEPDPQETLLLEKIAVENIGSIKNENSNADVKVEEPIIVNTKTENKTSHYFSFKFITRILEVAILSFVFVVLFNYGYRNIQTPLVCNKTSEFSPTPSVKGITNVPEVEKPITSGPSPTPSVTGVTDIPEAEKSLKILVIKTGEGFANVNIRSKPTTSSGIIGTAKEGDTFEYISLESGWYGVKTNDGVMGYIFADYLWEIGGTNK